MATARRNPEAELVDEVARCARDPLRFVRLAFPWGSAELADHGGPDAWQRDILLAVRDGLSLEAALRVAVASGHGIGKSALVSWLLLWAMATMPDTRGVVTANTEGQLKSKTWAELAKWYRLCICGHWFQLTATALFVPEHEKTWRVDMVAWSERNTEAFAGLHNQGRRIILIMDEASAIPDAIWEVSEGALTDSDTEILWFAFGNPTRTIGRFRECFGRFRARWVTRQIDSRTVAITNKAQIQQWIDDYGEDSDFVRVRVRGVFPSASSTQFIPGDIVDQAMKCEATATLYDPLIIAVDVARYGDDASVIWFRRGRDARTLRPLRFRKMDTMQLAARVAALIEEHKPDGVFVDEGGVGGGVIDRLRQLGQPVIGVNFGASADADPEGERYANKRAEIYGRGRQWLKTGGAIPDDPDLRADLEGVEYGYNVKGEILLESKESMKRRGLASPDNADALFLTFSHPVAQKAVRYGQPRVMSEYNPWEAA
jgi:Terminase RNaseH-like domain